ncbi:NFX1-type zinc finger-containing protein 1-like [Orbicella faveolata]|uniref:NFX1-type zinc finger-containing protein 1-like n=1 Tax=Orbicella faveolata TaxID=48498 RepID=UPI0009E1BBEB|nr:NFX1-type zinc finger-containing protein 1-like [Orbicella faveolata]
MTNPSKLKNSFLPTMPDDEYTKAMKGILDRGKWYECGNCSLPYFIGECSRPMQKTKCNECGNILGGADHKFQGKYRECDR